MLLSSIVLKLADIFCGIFHLSHSLFVCFAFCRWCVCVFVVIILTWRDFGDSLFRLTYLQHRCSKNAPAFKLKFEILSFAASLVLILFSVFFLSFFCLVTLSLCFHSFLFVLTFTTSHEQTRAGECLSFLGGNWKHLRVLNILFGTFLT